jgi:hypothetical protein
MAVSWSKRIDQGKGKTFDPNASSLGVVKGVQAWRDF